MNVDLNDVIDWLQGTPVDEDGRLILSRSFIVENLKGLAPSQPAPRRGGGSPTIKQLMSEAEDREVGYYFFDRERFAALLIEEAARVLDVEISPSAHPYTSLGRKLKEHFGLGDKE